MISFLASLVSIFLNTISFACKYSYGLHEGFWIASLCLMTMFQICQLQSILSEPRVYSTRYGYQNWLYYFIYIVGVLIMLYYFSTCWFSLKYEIIDNHGCKIMIEPDKYWFYQFPVILMYIMYDIYGLLLIIFKRYQYENEETCFQLQDGQLYKKIVFLLTKIFALSVIFELMSLLTFIIDIIPTTTGQLIFYHIITCVYHVFAVFFVYIMIERNNEDYMKFVEKCVCCCRQRILMYSNDLDFPQKMEIVNNKRTRSDEDVMNVIQENTQNNNSSLSPPMVQMEQHQNGTTDYDKRSSYSIL